MRMIRFALCGVALLAPAGLVAQEKGEVPAIQAIDLKGVSVQAARGQVQKPSVLDSAKDLARAIPKQEERARIEKQIDWKKQHVLLFSWSGSGGDKLDFTVSKVNDKEQVAFHYTRGLTRDLRPHVKMFVVRKGVTWKFKD